MKRAHSLPGFGAGVAVPLPVAMVLQLSMYGPSRHGSDLVTADARAFRMPIYQRSRRVQRGGLGHRCFAPGLVWKPMATASR